MKATIPEQPQNDLLTVKEAAKFLKISERKLFDLTVPQGTLRCMRIGRKKLYLKSDIQEWIARHQ